MTGLPETVRAQGAVRAEGPRRCRPQAGRHPSTRAKRRGGLALQHGPAHHHL